MIIVSHRRLLDRLLFFAKKYGALLPLIFLGFSFLNTVFPKGISFSLSLWKSDAESRLGRGGFFGLWNHRGGRLCGQYSHQGGWSLNLRGILWLFRSLTFFLQASYVQSTHAYENHAHPWPSCCSHTETACTQSSWFFRVEVAITVPLSPARIYSSTPL